MVTGSDGEQRNWFSIQRRPRSSRCIRTPSATGSAQIRFRTAKLSSRGGSCTRSKCSTTRRPWWRLSGLERQQQRRSPSCRLSWEGSRSLREQAEGSASPLRETVKDLRGRLATAREASVADQAQIAALERDKESAQRRIEELA